jgi:Family of unknown function (DUF6188)
VAEGCQIRELPDGGQEFVLDEPSLSFIRIDRQSRLQFGDTEVVISSRFAVVRDGNVHRLDPQQSVGLGPLVSLFPATVRWMWTSPEGSLSVVFQNGAVVSVDPDPSVRAWSVGSVYCLPTRSPGPGEDPLPRSSR